MGAIIRFTFSSFKTQQMSKKKEKRRTSRRLQYNKKVRSLKVNFLWQVHNLKQKKRKFGASVAVLCRGCFS